MTEPKNPLEPTSPWSQPTGTTPAAPPIGATPATPPTPGSDPAPPLWAPTSGSQATPSTPATPALDVPVAPVSTVRPAARRRRGLLDVVLVVAAVVAVSGVGFAAGRVTAPASAAATTAGRGNGQLPGGTGGQGGTGANGGQFPGGGQGGLGLGGGLTVSGEVVEITADHLTLKLANGQSVQIALSDTTTYHSQAAATAADVTTGSTVQVQVGRAGGTGGGAAGPGASARPGNGRPFGSASDVTVVPK